MKKHSQDELQRLLEEGVTINQLSPISEEDTKDFQIYKSLFEVLRKEPEAGPSYDFSKKVTAALLSEISSKRKKKSDFSLAFLLCMCVTGSLGVMLFTDSLFHTGLIQMVLSAKWIFLFCFICLILVQFADQKILQAKLGQH